MARPRVRVALVLTGMGLLMFSQLHRMLDLRQPQPPVGQVMPPAESGAPSDARASKAGVLGKERLSQGSHGRPAQ